MAARRRLLRARARTWRQCGAPLRADPARVDAPGHVAPGRRRAPPAGPRLRRLRPRRDAEPRRCLHDRDMGAAGCGRGVAQRAGCDLERRGLHAVDRSHRGAAVRRQGGDRWGGSRTHGDGAERAARGQGHLCGRDLSRGHRPGEGEGSGDTEVRSAHRPVRGRTARRERRQAGIELRAVRQVAAARVVPARRSISDGRRTLVDRATSTGFSPTSACGAASCRRSRSWLRT